MPAQHRFYLPPRPRFLDTLLFDKKLSRGRLVGSVFTPLGGPGFTSLGETSIYVAWRAQYLYRLARPVFTPLGEPSIYVAWRTQIYTAWRNQYLRRLAQTKPFPRGGRVGMGAANNQRSDTTHRLAEPVFTPLSKFLSRTEWTHKKPLALWPRG